MSIPRRVLLSYGGRGALTGRSTQQVNILVVHYTEAVSIALSTGCTTPARGLRANLDRLADIGDDA